MMEVGIWAVGGGGRVDPGLGEVRDHGEVVGGMEDLVGSLVLAAGLVGGAVGEEGDLGEGTGGGVGIGGGFEWHCESLFGLLWSLPRSELLYTLICPWSSQFFDCPIDVRAYLPRLGPPSFH